MALAAWGHAQRFNRYMPGDAVSNRRQAIDLANAALALAPDDPGVLVPAGQALLLAGSDEDRAVLLSFRKAPRRSIRTLPPAGAAWGSCRSRSEPVEARKAFEHALRLSPLDPKAVWGRAGIADIDIMERSLVTLLAIAGQAISDLANAAIALAPDDPGVLVPAGQALLLRRVRRDRAVLLSLWQGALARSELCPGQRRMGQLQIARSEPVEARKAFEHALRLSPLDPKAVWDAGIADIDIMEGRGLEEALRLYRQCFVREATREGLFRRRECALLALTGEVEEARLAWRARYKPISRTSC